MKVVVDGEVREEFAEAPDLFAVLASVSDLLRERRRGIVDCAQRRHRQPRNVRDQMLGSRRAGRCHGFQDRAGRKTGRSALSRTGRLSPELAKACRSLAKFFQSDAPENGYEMFRDLAGRRIEIKSREAKAASVLELDLDTLLIEGVFDVGDARGTQRLSSRKRPRRSMTTMACCWATCSNMNSRRAGMETEIVALLRRQTGTDAE